MVSPWLETPRRESPRKSTRTRTRLSTPPRLQQHCGQFKLFWGHPQIKLTDRGVGGILGVFCGKMCLSVSTFFRIQKVPTHFFGAFLAHMAVRPGAHCYQTDAIYTVQNTRTPIQQNTIYPIITFTGCKRKVWKRGYFGSCIWLCTTMRSHTNDRVRNLLKEPALCVLNSFNKVAKKLHPALFTKVPLWIGGW